MLLRFDYPLAGSTRPVTWIKSHTTEHQLLGLQLAQSARLPANLLIASSLQPAAQMDQVTPDDSSSPKTATRIAKHQPLLAPFSEAAKSLLSSPLPPELVVDFKSSSGTPPTNVTTSAQVQLRNSTSESDVHHLPAEVAQGTTTAYRTLSDGARKSYARRKLESEDSSYDSDYECSENVAAFSGPSADFGALTEPTGCTGSVPSGPSSSGLSFTPLPLSHQSQQHEDVSRTVSDTLAAEFNEYVCVHNPSFKRLSETASDDSDDSEESTVAGVCVNDPSYSSRVEFALKLGYTELQVQKSLAKLGPQPAQNELLAELIRLASLAGPSSGTGSTIVSESSDVSSEYSVNCHRPLSLTSSDDAPLRHIVIDGSNVAVSHGNKEVFSCRGIQLCVDWFRSRGHREITVFVPMWRKETSKIDTPISNQELLLELERERILTFTPSRQVNGRRLVCYDDRYILKLAAETDGIVVSNDNYRDLISECPEYKRIVEERILMYSFVNDRFMPPDDPLGRNGPKLERFLRKPFSGGGGGRCGADATASPCPYGKKCTYGNKCKYYHPERGNLPQKTITERLAENAQRQLLEVKARSSGNSYQQQPFAIMGPKKNGPVRELMPTCKTLSLPLAKEMPGQPLNAAKPPSPTKKTLARTKSIVASVSLLPTELVEERPVQDGMVSNSEDNQGGHPIILKSRSVENMAKTSPRPNSGHNLLIQQQQQSHIHHGPMMNAPPPLPTFSVPPPITIDGGFGNKNWNQRGSSGHLPLCQKLSDPPSASVSKHGGDLADSEEIAQHNPHRKVQRQLTLNPLNPACDPRLYTLKGLAPPYPPPPFAVHSIVTRNASAPAPASQLSQTASTRSHPHTLVHQQGNHMQRLNSTSDTQLNLYGAAAAMASSQDWTHSVHSLGDPFDDWTKAPPPHLPHSQQQQQQQIHQNQHQHIQQHIWCTRTSSLPAHHNQLSSSNAQPPPLQSHHQQVFDSDASKGSSSSSNNGSVTLGSEARYKLFFHLAAIFPEDQVRQVMTMMPEETNAQKICAAILSLYPKEN